MGGGELIGFVSVVLTVGVIPVGILLLIHKVQTKKMDTLVKLAEMGGTLDPETMKMLSGTPGDYRTDYKWGLIWLAIGVPVFFGTWLEVGMQQAAFAAIPALIGVAFIISGKFRLRDSD